MKSEAKITPKTKIAIKNIPKAVKIEVKVNLILLFLSSKLFLSLINKFEKAMQSNVLPKIALFNHIYL